jgi:hypothetical protein
MALVALFTVRMLSTVDKCACRTECAAAGAAIHHAGEKMPLHQKQGSLLRCLQQAQQQEKQQQQQAAVLPAGDTAL